MKLSTLLESVTYTAKLDVGTEITEIVRDSREATADAIFFAIKGVESDGHDYAKQALKQGAAAVVVERDLGLENQILVEDTHYAYGICCGNFHDNPSKKLKLIGITGTNGKTTTTYIVKGILDSLGKKTGLIGTIENIIGDISIQARFTTPDPIQLHALLDRMVNAGCEYVVMEVSSHAMAQKRLAGCHFVASAFTNLTQDHLDFHGNMENYFSAKKSLFDISDTAVINIDDSYGKRLINDVKNNIITFSASNNGGDLTASSVSFSANGSDFMVQYKGTMSEARFIQPGEFSVANALTALGLTLGIGISFENAVKGLKQCPAITGRFEVFPLKKDYTVIRDFAHSPDGLKQLLSTVKAFATGRIITLFGCAGERDRSKRKDMSSIAAEYSDYCILAPDNPRSEPIEQINSDAIVGFEKWDTPYKVFDDRFEAILWALKNNKPNDFLILAGKGHEDYQVLDYGTINFNEKELVLDILK